MHPRRSRIRSAALVVATAVAAGLGWLWWTSTAPERPPEAAPPEPAPQPALAPSRFPSPSEVLTYDTLPIEDRLPDADEVLYRDSAPMTPNTVLEYDGPISAGTELVLQFICTGSGTIEIEIVLPDDTDTYRHECDSPEVQSIEFGTASTGYSSLRLTAPDAYLIGVAYQLVLRR